MARYTCVEGRRDGTGRSDTIDLGWQWWTARYTCVEGRRDGTGR